MKGLETGKDKIQKICDSLRKETLEPAKQEAREVIENAHIQAETIVNEAKAKADQMIQDATKAIEEKQKVCASSLQLACRQAVELLKQKIEKELFDKTLSECVVKESKDPKVINEIIHSFIRSMEEKDVEEEFVVTIPKSITPREINALLGKEILEKLHKNSVSLGDFLGGVMIQLKERQITVDMTDASIRELIARYIRSDFRDLFFSA
jgi:V/A-type H+-transporting ATPase subunit E